MMRIIERSAFRGLLFTATSLVAGCLASGSAPGESGEKDPGANPAGEPMTPTVERCDETRFPGIDLETIVTSFTSEVHPLLVDENQGCIACHQADTMRMFTVTLDAVETFHVARAEGFFSDGPGSIVDRLTAANPGTRMPQAQPAWTSTDVQRVADIACALEALQNQTGGPPADEMFPPNLLEPFVGPPNQDDDLRFLTYVQLKNKVRDVFGDDWVRDGTDRFAETIGLFGGVDFETTFVEARTITPEFLLGLDSLSAEVCSTAAAAATGPFENMTLSGPIDGDAAARAASSEKVALLYERMLFRSPFGSETGEAIALVASLSAFAGGEVGAWTGLCEALMRHPDFLVVRPPTIDLEVVPIPSVVQHDEAEDLVGSVGGVGGGGTAWNLWTNGTLSTSFTSPADAEYELRTRVWGTQAGPDLPRMELRLDGVVLQGFDVAEVGGSPGTYAVRAAVSAGPHDLTVAFTNDFYDPPNDRNLLVDWLEAEGPLGLGGAFGDAARNRLRLVHLCQTVLSRPPSRLEFEMLEGSSLEAMVDHYLSLDEFRDYYFERMRLRTESAGSANGDEPARLWAHLAFGGGPFQELLTADYTVDENWQVIARPDVHGQTGVLTMKGFIENKPGLPHYNYAARVMTDFMGVVFEVPPEVFEQRATSTPSSTVDPNGICFSCHQVLTPLAHQRLKWDDAGNYREVDDQGEAIDDSDRDLVPGYKFSGSGMEAFSLQAVKKEAFVRRMLDAQYQFVVGRAMRVEEDERGTYKQLWDLADESNGNLKAVIKAIIMSEAFLGR